MFGSKLLVRHVLSLTLAPPDVTAVFTICVSQSKLLRQCTAAVLETGVSGPRSVLDVKLVSIIRLPVGGGHASRVSPFPHPLNLHRKPQGKSASSKRTVKLNPICDPPPRN